MTTHIVYVPAPGSAAAAQVLPRSGMVGTAHIPTRGQDDRVLCDFEGNAHQAVNLVTYADRVHVAAGRHETRYPTIARATFARTDLREVGIFDSETGEITLGDTDPLLRWLGIDLSELPAQLVTTSARHQNYRAIREAVDSPDPRERAKAALMADRLGIAL